jgi:PAS domain S-box-containing protein
MSVMQGGQIGPHEYRVRIKSGRYLIGEFVTAPQIIEGRIVGVLGVARDITDRSRMEEELRNSEEKFRNLAEHSLQGIFVMYGNRPIFANSRMAELFDTTIDIILNTSAEDFFRDLTHPQFVEEMRSRYSRRNRGETVDNRYETKIFTRKGRERWIEIFTQQMMFEGKPALQGAILDITERKEAENALEYRLAFEELITGISTGFINLGSGEVDAGIDEALCKIGAFSNVDRSFLFRLTDDLKVLDTTNLWLSPLVVNPFGPGDCRWGLSNGHCPD